MSKNRKQIAKDIRVSSRKNKQIQGEKHLQIEDLSAKAEELLEKLRSENSDLKDRLLRNAAEYENSRKLIEKETRSTIESSMAGMFREMIDILDNFDRAIDHMNNGNGTDKESIMEGIKKIDRRFHDFLEKFGVEPYSADGQRFDPSLHEAISVTTNPDLPDGQVIEEFVKGYRFRGKVLRPSRVVVNKVAEESEENYD